MESGNQCAMIITEDALKGYLAKLRKKNISKVALDMEGDQGMFHYNYSISILQCFDGEEAAVIDVLKMGANDTLREFLTCQDITKVMFSCGNDIYMTQHVLGCTITPINDIAIAQKLLGLPINLVDYLDIDKEQKDCFQRANWLLRPIKPALLEYAVNDVLKLLDIENDLVKQLIEQGQYDNYINSSKSASEKTHNTNKHTMFHAKFPGYSRLSFEKKKTAAGIWIFRELLGKKFDCPVGYLLSRKALTAIITSKSDPAIAIEKEINKDRKASKRLSMGMIETLFEEAMESPHIPQKSAVKRRQFRP